MATLAQRIATAWSALLGRQQRDPYAGTYGASSGAGFAGAHVGRLTASLATWSGSVNAELDAALPVLRARARALARNTEHGKRFVNLCATNIVGRSHPKLQVRALRDQRNPNAPTTLDTAANAAIEAHWAAWGDTCDITGRHRSLAAFLRTVVKAVARDGETLVRPIRSRGAAYGLTLQHLAIDRLDEALNQRLDNGNAIRQGVEIDGTGRPVAYWVRTQHPGDNYLTQAPGYERIPAGDVWHVMLPEDAEQVRGIPWMHAVIRRASTLAEFEEAAVVAAKIGASKIAALQRADDAPDALAGMADAKVGNNYHMQVEAGELFELPPGYTLNSWNPEYPHANFESFLKACLRGLSAGLDVAAHNLTGDMTDVNYSSARIAELGERETWMVLQDWLISTLVRPIYQEWLAIALLRGDITFPVSGSALPAERLGKFAAASGFQGRRWAWVDPAKEQNANEQALANFVTSRTRLAAEAGEEFDDILAERAEEEAALRAAGLLPVAAPAAPAQPAPAPPAPTP